MSTTVDETEIKYEAPPGTTVPRLGGLPSVAGASGPEEQLLEAEYYDTDDLRLIRNGITLRRRRGGSDPGWHLKLPAGGSTRREIRVPPGRGGRQVPARLAGLVRGYTRGEKLRPVARISTRRQVLTLVDSAGASLAEIAADDVSAQSLGGETVISQWAEVEVELTGGGPRLLKAADAQLRRDGLRPSARSAKLERALGWTEHGGPEHGSRQAAANGRSGPRQAAPPASAGDIVLAYLQEHAARLGSMDPMVRADEPDSVHQMRVSTRRLRSTLQTFGEVIPRSGTGEILAELKWLGGVLGEARDAEVLASRLAQNLRTIPAEVMLGPVQARVQGHFAPIQAAARRNVLAALDSARYFALRDTLDELLADPPLSAEAARPAGRVLPGAARRSLPAHPAADAPGPACAPRPTPGAGVSRGPEGRQAGPVRRRGSQPGRGQAGQALHQADEKRPDGARRPPGCGGGPGRGPGTRYRRSPGRRERVHLRAAVRTGRPAGRPAAGEGAADLEADSASPLQPLAQITACPAWPDQPGWPGMAGLILE